MSGRIKGLLHYLIIYELRDFLNIKILDENLAVEASKIRVLGDKLLASPNNLALYKRILSVADATIIALAMRGKYRS